MRPKGAIAQHARGADHNRALCFAHDMPDYTFLTAASIAVNKEAV